MQENIHPKYEAIQVKCSCGESWETASTLGKDVLNIEKCPKCHVAYTGKETKKDTLTRAKAFEDKFKSRKKIAAI